MKIKIIYSCPLILLVLLFLFPLYSCSSYINQWYAYTDKSETINCNEMLDFSFKDPLLRLDAIIDTIVVIQLETKEESLIRILYEIIVSDENIYIHSFPNDVLIFDRDGRFKKKLQRGNGPGELYDLDNIAYNKINEELVAFQTGRVCKYTKEGIYLNSYDFPYVTRKVVNDGNGYDFLIAPSCNSMEKYVLGFVDSAMNVPNDGKIYLFDKYPEILSSTFLSDASCGGIYIPRQIENNVYLFNNDSLFLKYQLDFSDYQMEIENGDSWQRFTERNASAIDKFYFNADFVETNGFQVFRLCGSQNYWYCFRNKTTGKSIFGFRYDSDGDYTGLPLVRSCYGVYNDYFITFVQYMPNQFEGKEQFMRANEHISQNDVDKIKNLKENDNPLIILYKLKGLE